MSFRDDCYYVIRPKDSLLGRLAERPTDGDELLTDPQVWRRSESSHDLSSPEERMSYVKVIFLGWLHHDYLAKLTDEIKDQFYIHLQEMLGSEPFTPSVFDQWWTIERIEHSESLDEIERRMGVVSLCKVAAPGFNYVKQHLHRLTEEKTEAAKTTA